VSEIRRLLAVQVANLNTMRIICKRPRCGAALEVSLERAGSIEAKCPVCNYEFPKMTGGKPSNVINSAAKAIENLQAALDMVQIEFVVPTPKGES
jgi:transcription initiation factor IIE alpha subunit